MRTGVLILCLVLSSAESRPAEIRLRAKCVPRGPIVTLGDVAEVLAADAAVGHLSDAPGHVGNGLSTNVEKLASEELFPAPAPGQQRTLKVRELQDLLSDRGISLAGHRLSGSSQVVIAGPVEPERVADRHPVSAALVQRAERVVAEAIVQWLRKSASPDAGWEVAVKLSDAQAKAIPADPEKLFVRSGQPLGPDVQQFEVITDDADPPRILQVKAQVARRRPVVATTRAIGRGAIIRPADVRLQPPPAGPDRNDTFHDLEDVVGTEATQAIAAGTVLQKSAVRPPVLVRRGEAITVYSRAAGIQIRVPARAQEDGSLGELIQVESLSNRKTYAARVCGPQEAEVYARATQAGPSPISVAATSARVGATKAIANPPHRRESEQQSAVPVSTMSEAWSGANTKCKLCSSAAP